ncbi:GDP-mannose 4,6-dehydratase [Alicyclobacillus fastidiosus]|uniref:GDP-mannose 4,6-dehydratase n=1 Tax=Alicyclobacillus fastidiosus TaxID=392011 RepID=A0ABV5AHC6_9BACL|nr:GDP-mannose 4,6-dehydratase [Alicyclobacillus fastidiosus]WEH08892.1 GDP-mannose 4,6-dehydratase [Alicyclobacillus fastidiosus]
MKSGDRVLVTGANGFVGEHVIDFLAATGVESIATGRALAFRYPRTAVPYYRCDLFDLPSVVQMFKAVKPTCVVHLASENSVGTAWQNPQKVIHHNVLTTAHLLEAVICSEPATRVIVVGSAHEYAPPANSTDALPLTEHSPTIPTNPYGWSKLLQTLVSCDYALQCGVPVTVARTFNLVGPGATNGVCAKIAQSIVQIERGEAPPELTLGSLRTQRDFLDVRDAVSAYWHLLTQTATPGNIFNVCSGRPVSLSALVELFRQASKVPFRVVEDPSLYRPDEAEIVYGSAQKLSDFTGWRPTFSLERSIADVLDYFRTNNRN